MIKSLGFLCNYNSLPHTGASYLKVLCGEVLYYLGFLYDLLYAILDCYQDHNNNNL